MTCDISRLRAYVDGALSADEQAAVVAHLTGCAGCREELAARRERAAAVAVRLSALEPNTDEMPAPAQALARFRLQTTQVPQTRPEPGGLWAALGRRFTMLKTISGTSRWRPVAVGATAMACLLILFSFAPVRQAAADFLGLFRVRKFAVIPIDAAQQEKLESLAKLAEDGQFGQPATVREPGKPQPVASLAEASQAVGFGVRAPSALPSGASQKSLEVQTGPAIHYEMDRAAMQALVAATQAQGVTLPPGDKITIDVDVPSAVIQEFAIGSGWVKIMQLAAPQVDIPAGIDPAIIGEAGFRFLGMPDADARRLAQSIDWTSTLVIPLPSDILQYREVTVDGVNGLLIEHRPGGQGSRRAASLLWQKDGIVYAVETNDIDPLVAMQMADSLK